jgi:hypothetical protein
VACADSDSVAAFQRCDVDALLEPESAGVGDIVTVTGRPMTDIPDTEVLVGGAAAEVLSVDRTDCTVCDACIEAAACSPCGTCDACAVSCEACMETATFAVPEVTPGTQAVVLINAYGSTLPLALEVTAATEPGDTDLADTDPLDTDIGETDTDV